MADPQTPPAAFADAWDQAHEAAVLEAGSDDFGPPDYKWGLRVLLESMDYDPHFTPAGRMAAWSSVTGALASRAVAYEAMKANPGYANATIHRPIVIFGLPRTGTTALHRLLLEDPQFQGPEKWLLSAPMPRPPREGWEENRWYQKEIAELNARFGDMPEQRAAHNMMAEEVDECLWLQRQSFVSHMWATGWSAPTYDTWWVSQPETASYDYLRDCLQMMGMGDSRQWLLKNPSQVLHLDELFRIFPDALVIQTHRDPAKAVPSLCALLMQAHEIMEESRYDLRARTMCLREVAKWAKGVRDTMPVREAHSDQVMDVIHGEFHADPMKVVRQIYAFARLDMNPQIEERMASRIQAKPELAHGVHRYHVSDFGLTEGDIREQYADYIAAFDL